MPSLAQDLYMIPFKLVEGVIYVIISVIILKRNKKQLLNQIYFISILGWGIYIFLDMILYPLAHFETSYFSTITINSTEWVSPMIANILRDIALISAGALPIGFLYASIILKYGKAHAIKPKIVFILLLLYFLFVIPTIIFDLTIRSGDFVKSYFNIGSGLMILAQIVIFLIGIVYLVQLYLKFKDALMKKSIRHLILGSSLLLAGIVFFLLVGFMNISAYAAITGPIGHLMWMVGAIFIYKGIIAPGN